jgi:nucleolar GTP-binding protein
LDERCSPELDLRWQVIDTPGILDHPLEEMNTIEMQSVTALAYLRSCVLYFMDLSGECGYSVAQQVQLFQNIRQLFANKVTFLAINKIDRVQPSDLDTETQTLVQGLLADGTVEVLELSCATEEGVMLARNRACEKSLVARVEQKLKGGRINDVLNKIHLATPMVHNYHLFQMLSKSVDCMIGMILTDAGWKRILKLRLVVLVCIVLI